TACGAIVGGVAWAWRGDGLIAVAIGAAILAAMITACLLGVALPMAVRLFGLDPRIAAGPVVLALGDLAALLFYFSLAQRVVSN
ncbi:MAG: magnesium transporter, partial [Planctomycetes bacterium]|nr:magnesium transporter [Planctomycetota bacterium]